MAEQLLVLQIVLSHQELGVQGKNKVGLAVKGNSTSQEIAKALISSLVPEPLPDFILQPRGSSESLDYVMVFVVADVNSFL